MSKKIALLKTTELSRISLNLNKYFHQKLNQQNNLTLLFVRVLFQLRLNPDDKL